jgi:hypothetical protein
LIARLVDNGVTVQVPASRSDAYGDERTFDPRTAGSVLLVASRFGGLDGLRVVVAVVGSVLAWPLLLFIDACAV